jgi:transposase-like protein
MPKSRSRNSFSQRRRWSADDARAALAALSASGLSARAFAAREGLDVQRLQRWRRRLAASHEAAEAEPRFVEVVGQPAGVVEVVLRSGRVLRCSESIEAHALERIATVLEELPAC